MDEEIKKHSRRQIKDIVERIAILETKIDGMEKTTSDKIDSLKEDRTGKIYLKIITLALSGIYLWLGVITQYILSSQRQTPFTP